jgi:hypothetical protein
MTEEDLLRAVTKLDDLAKTLGVVLHSSGCDGITCSPAEDVLTWVDANRIGDRQEG